MHKRLYRTVESLLERIDHSAGDEKMLVEVLHLLVDNPAARSLGIASGRLYREQARNYKLIESIGGRGEAIAGKTVSKNYQVVRDIERRRLWVISPRSPGFDPDLESQFGDHNSAAILVGRDPAYILSLGVEHRGSDDDLLVLLETIRAAVGFKLREQALASQMRQARTIQHSLLPARFPVLEGFEFAALSLPADEVGGDVYDLQEVEPDVVGILLADASGHGLPAALQARDVVTGMRMGQAQGEKINLTVGRLNRVINGSGLASRFVSLFYGELEASGSVAYVNGGHPPPLLVTKAGEVFELQTSGPVLGPLPDAAYRRGYLNLQPGEMLILYSDGVTERQRSFTAEQDGEPVEFGRDRLAALVVAQRDQDAKDVAHSIVRKVKEFGKGAPLADDVSVMVVKRMSTASHSSAEDLTRLSAGDKR